MGEQKALGPGCRFFLTVGKKSDTPHKKSANSNPDIPHPP
jgi:hypothetical protein